MLNLDAINGIPIIVSPLAEEVTRKQTKFPRSKRRRIIKKWSKQDRNYSVTHKPLSYLVQGKLICHPIIYEQLRREFGNGH
jgi:hypothetical protein